MRKYFFFSFFLIILTANCLAQNVQWAAEVVDFSSQYGKEQYSAKQALGVPNAFYNDQLHYMAWVPLKASSHQGEFIQVRFANPMKVYQVAVAESLNPGAISKIFFLDKKGKKYKIYENRRPKGQLGNRLFRKKLAYKTDYLVEQVRIELNTKAVKGSNQIDAIAISDSRAPIKVKVDVVDYKEELSKPERLSTNVNSLFAERAPIISPDGQTLYFARKYHPKNIGEENKDDIWKSYRLENGSWSKAVNIGAPLNNKRHNFVIAVNPQGNLLYVADEGVACSRKKGRTWNKPKAQSIKNFQNDSEFVAYHVNTQGNVLLMAVQRDDSYGNRDLYVSFLEKNNKWTKPLNLGPDINTVGIESSVFIAADGKTIYFSSNGHEGFGGLDMFMSRRLDDSWTNWSKPKNLGDKINSFNNDYNYSIPASGEYAYFSTDDKNGMSDIFRIKLPKEVQPEPVVLLSGKMIDKETKQSVKAKLKYLRFNQKEKEENLQDVADSEFQMVLPYGEQIGVYAELEGYFSTSENINLSNENLEGVDSDGNGMIAQVGEGPVHNQDVEKLQLRLKDLNEELEELDVQRKKAKQEIRRKRKKQPRQYQSDPELDALRHKYNQSIREEERTDFEDNEIKIKSSGDSELDKLKRKYKQYRKEDQGEEEKEESASILNPTVKEQKSETASGESELEKLKQKFNRHHSKGKPGDKETTTTATTTTTIINPKQSKEKLKANLDFDALQNKLIEELNAELPAKVKRELQEELFDSVQEELIEESNLELEHGLSPKFGKKLESQLQKKWKAKFKKEVRANLKTKKRSGVEKELRKKLESQVRKELRVELKEVVREELKQELMYLVKKEIEAAVKEELEAKIRAQIKEETKPKTKVTAPVELEESTEVELAYQELTQDIILIPIKVGQVIPMNNVFFDANEASLKEISFKELNRVLQFLENNKQLIVEVGGHTNGWCSHEFANELSRDRSEAVAKFLTDKGIVASRIKFRGYGKTQPIESNDTLKGRKKNQRVELKILEVLK